MSRYLVLIAGLMALNAPATVAAPVEARDEWTEHFEVTAAAPTLEIRNIWGDVRVSAGSSGEITLHVREHRTAPDRERFERSLEVYGLEVQADVNGVDVRVGDRGQEWHHRDRCRRCRVEYRLEVRVPPETKVYASTINDGGVVIDGIRGAVSAANVNGPVSIDGVRACEVVDSINGDVRIAFETKPAGECDIETINGDIDLVLPDDAGMDLAVDLGNGRVTSELAVDPVAIPARVEHTRSGDTNQYRIEQAAGVRIAGGGALFSVSSMNGDLRIQKRQ